MQDLIETALKQGNYPAAADLLQQWKRKDPRDPWLLLAIAQYQEAIGKWETAERTYLKLLQKAALPKLMGHARQGIQRVQTHLLQAREAALATARSSPDSDAPGILCLEPVRGEAARTAAAQGLAKILQIDPYMARLQLPSKGWRLHRVGPLGELRFLGESLRAAQTPAFWVNQTELKQIQTFQVNYFRSVGAQGTVVCQNETGQLGEIGFDWAEISQAVTGSLPLFESVLDRDAWGKLERKEKTQDYAEVIDLHLRERRCILRLCDRAYEFKHGNPLPDLAPQETASPSRRRQWNALRDYVLNQVSGPIQSGFTNFGEGALEYIDLMPFFEAHMPLVRRQDTPWDAAFHLYSGLHFVRSSPESADRSHQPG
ncbi:MAG: tetratricopeptide repeat protein [Leptolyngbya sp. RL_3_1]|nr:tetratricopeptide repeat protein [Leptolyngbya sp. RL_3_1]